MPNYIDLFPGNYAVSQMGTGLSVNPMNYVNTAAPALNIDPNGPAVLLNVLEQASGVSLASTSSNADKAWNAWLAAFANAGVTDVNDFLTWLNGVVSSTNAAVTQIWLTIQNIFNSVVGGIDTDVTAFITAISDSITQSSSAFQAWDVLFTDLGFSVTTASEFATFLTGVANAGPWPGVTNAQAIANGAIYKPSYLAIDATADAVFHVSQITSPLTNASVQLTLTPTASVIGYIGTPDAGLKQSIIWLAPTVGSGLTLYFGVYQVNTTTGALTKMATIGPVTTAAAGWNYTTIPTPFVSVQGAWYAVELMMEGTPSSNFLVTGLPAHGVPVNTISAAFPQSMAASRNSTNIPVFDQVSTMQFATGTTTAATTVSFTAAAGADVFVFAEAFVTNAGTTISSWTVTYGGTAMTQEVSANPANTSTFGVLTVFRLAGGGSGSAKTISVSVTAASALVVNLRFGVVSYTNVGGIFSLLNNTGTATALTMSATGITDGLLIAGFGAVSDTNTLTISAFSGTQRGNIAGTISNYPALAFGENNTVLTFNETATLSASQPYGVVGLVLEGTPALPPSTVAAPGPPFSSNVPFFALGGGLGIPQHAPYQQTYTTNGTFTIPSWMIIGDLIDIVVLSDGGGGAPGSTIFSYGGGGFSGNWFAVSLVYGVDIPLTTTSITFTIGQGGAGGIIEINSGIAGTGCVVNITGYASTPITVAGGANGAFDFVYFGQTAGNYTFSSGLGNTTYPAGGLQTISSANGNPAGGGGSGGQYLIDGGSGAPGQIWITAYQ